MRSVIASFNFWMLQEFPTQSPSCLSCLGELRRQELPTSERNGRRSPCAHPTGYVPQKVCRTSSSGWGGFA